MEAASLASSFQWPVAAEQDLREKCTALPGVAILGAVISASLGVDPLSVVAALAAQAWMVQPPIIDVSYRDESGSTAPDSEKGMRPRGVCYDHAADVLHLALLCPSGMGMERLLTLLDEAFGCCLSYHLPPTLPCHEGAPLLPRPTYAVGTPVVSHQRLVKPSLTRTARQVVPEQWARAAKDSAAASDPTPFAQTVVYRPR